MGKRVECRISFGGLLGVAKGRDHHVALIPNFSDKKVLEGRLPPWVSKCMTKHHARILVRGGTIETRYGGEITERPSSMISKKRFDFARTIEFEHLELITPAHDGPVATPALVTLAGLTARLPGSQEDKKISPALFRHVYGPKEPRVVGRIKFKPTPLATGDSYGEHHFKYVQGPPITLAKEVFFTAEVDSSTGVRLKARKLSDRPGNECEIRILPDGSDCFEVLFENSPQCANRAWNPDFAVHFNLLDRPQVLKQRVPFPKGRRDPWEECEEVEDCGPEANDPQCSPADYGDVPGGP